MNISRLFLLIMGAALLWSAALFGYVAYIEQLDTDGRVAMQRHANHSIVVLTGGDQRIAAGLELLQDGVAPKLFISGVGEGVRLQDVLPELSVDTAKRIFLGREARDTLGNAHEVAAWLAETRGKAQSPRVVLVSAHYHLPRALWHFTSRMPEVTWIPYAAHPEALPLENWYGSLLGWRLLSSELAKFLGSKFMQVFYN